MKILVTPSKELKVKNINKCNKEILFSEEYNFIVKNLQKYDIEDLMNLYKTKESIAEENFNRWKNIDKVDKYPAIDLFNGLMYRSIKHDDFSEVETDFLNENLRIISPLYGVLRPLDAISKHRLDFSKNFKLSNEEKLVEFWKDKVSEYILKEKGMTVNLLSSEFYKVLNKDVLDRSIYVKFYELNEGELKVHSTISKNGRGAFVRYLAKNKVENLKGLKEFDYDGYFLDKEKSTNNELFFIRKA